MPSDYVSKRDRAKYLSGMEWALIVDALIMAGKGSRYSPEYLLGSELADRGLADN